ncbi:MAG TPA: dihydrodipicolinate reductase C-terminal domain-containing protein [Gemmatimonadales bacterium]|nr:dihydrodipicolinate reductase C-terminal domain-containing protein [Gemmatimonadales bacterium]
MTPLRIAIIGHGKMGRAVAALAEKRGHRIHTIVKRIENPGGRALTAERLAGTDVAVEFTRPDAVVVNLERLIDLGIPTVTGTTGWTEELPRVTAKVEQQRGALLHAPNFATGVQLFFRAARELARCFRGRHEFTVGISEEHHQAKLDAPSGTALLLQRQLWAEEPGRRFPISSIRSGDSPGIHSLTYQGQHETVTLSHVSHSRDAFAAGAVTAAEWLPGRTGVFTFEEMLFGAAT